MVDMKLPVIDINWDFEGIFKARPNRFLGIVDILEADGTSTHLENERVHVHDPGRLRELLYPNNRVLVKRAKNIAKRKTNWDLIAAVIDDTWVLIHSGYHRYIAEWVLTNELVSPFGAIETFKPEVQVGHSRLDFELIKNDGTKALVEVKGCTLAIDGRALFPDAPTERGRRHLETLMTMKSTQNIDGALLILVFRPDVACFVPHDRTDPKFGAVFRMALKNGIAVYPLVFTYENHTIYYNGQIPVCSDI